MKTRNILAIVSIIFTMVMASCSADSVLDDMSNQNASGEVVALACNVRMGAETRANIEGTEKPTEKEASVEEAIFFLVDGTGKVLASSAVGQTIYTKSQTGLKVIAVAGASLDNIKSNLIAQSTSDGIYNVALNATDLGNFVKVGEAGVDFTGVNKGDVKEVQVTVNQVAARIDLESLTIENIAADKVKLTGVSMVNQNLAGKLRGFDAEYNDEEVAGSLTDNKIGNNLCSSFYTFANAEDATAKVALRLTFDVDGKPVTVENVTIKHNDIAKVEAGYIYKLKLTAKITGENITSEVEFVVAPWKTSSITTDMEEVK